MAGLWAALNAVPAEPYILAGNFTMPRIVSSTSGSAITHLVVLPSISRRYLPSVFNLTGRKI